MNISRMLEIEEGFKASVYCCTEGYPTIGIGWKIGRHNQSLNDFEHMTMCKRAAYAQCEFMVADIHERLRNELPFFDGLNEPRQCVLISMAYQLGIKGLLGFKRMLAAIQTQCWNDAAHEGLDSKWHNQTTRRAERQMLTLLKGDWSEYEKLV